MTQLTALDSSKHKFNYIEKTSTHLYMFGPPWARAFDGVTLKY